MNILNDSLELTVPPELVNDSVFFLDENCRVIKANARACSVFGISSDQNDTSLKSFMPGEKEREKFQKYIKLCASSTNQIPGAATFVSSNGELHKYQIYGANYYNKYVDINSKIVVLIVITHGLTIQKNNFVALNDTIDQLQNQILARKRDEAQLQIEKRVLSDIVSGLSIDDALNTLCESIEDEIDGMQVSILLKNKNNLLNTVAAPSLPHAYTETINGLPIAEGNGSCGTAAHRNEVVIVSDTFTDSLWKEFREIAKLHNLRACWSVPILSPKDEVLGTFACYFSEEKTPSETELELITRYAYTASLAIFRNTNIKEIESLLSKEQIARKEAEAHIKSKDIFLATLSHEIRNPLNGILTAASLINESEIPDSMKKELNNQIIDEANNMKLILKDLLDISKLSHGKLALELKPINLNNFFNNFCRKIKSTFHSRIFNVEIESEIGYIKGDKIRLIQILNNLVENAFKYSDRDDAVSIIVKRKNDEAVIIVSDRGIGINSDKLQTIFEPFEQSDSNDSLPNHGLGLGLALAKQFTEMHDGTITARSDGPGHGSSFIIKLPTIEPPISPTAEKKKEVNNISHKQPRVLIVEDHDNSRFALSKLLKLKGYEVDTAENGLSGLNMIQNNPPDIALIDLGLPELNGVELVKNVYKKLPSINTKFIAMTGYGQKKDKQLTKEAGFDAHIVKPVDINNLISIIEDNLITV